VLRIAKELGYQPNVTARALRNKSTFLFGLVVPSIDQSFAASIVEGIQAVAMAHDYSCLLYITRGLPDLEVRSFDALLAKNADGIIWVPGQQVSPRVVALHSKVPILQLLNKEVSDLPAVLVDQVYGQYLASSYLCRLGHRHIGYAMINDRHSRERLIGHRKAMVEAGVPFDDAEVLMLDRGWPQKPNAIRSYLSNRPHLTAIAASTDLIAWHVIQQAQQLERRVPDSLSVTGFDDIEMASQTLPTITTVDQPKCQMGEVAMQLLKRCMEGEKVDDCLMQPRLVVRDSTQTLVDL
jgi:LacI family transcriptional regulator